jgi:hypothetical protein
MELELQTEYNRSSGASRVYFARSSPPASHFQDEACVLKVKMDPSFGKMLDPMPWSKESLHFYLRRFHLLPIEM